MSHHTVKDFYGKPQPCIGPSCPNTNEEERPGVTVRVFRHPDMGPVCPAHFSQWQIEHRLTRIDERGT